MDVHEVWRVLDAACRSSVREVADLAWLALLLAIATGAGCTKTPSPEAKATEEAKAFGALPGLKATPDQSLQDELTRVVTDGGTPELLASRQIPDESNIAAGLIALFDGVDRKRLAAIRAESDGLFPKGPFTLDPVQRERAMRFRQRYDDERMGARLALERPECRFPIAFEAGPADELAFLDVVWICSRLEAFSGGRNPVLARRRFGRGILRVYAASGRVPGDGAPSCHASGSGLHAHRGLARAPSHCRQRAFRSLARTHDP